MTDLTTQPVRNPHADRSIDVADARRRMHPWRVVTGVLLALVTVQIVVFFATNERFDWPVVAEYLFNPSLGLKVRGVFEQYRSKAGLPSVNGNQIGVVLNFYF